MITYVQTFMSVKVFVNKDGPHERHQVECKMQIYGTEQNYNLLFL